MKLKYHVSHKYPITLLKRKKNVLNFKLLPLYFYPPIYVYYWFIRSDNTKIREFRSRYKKDRLNWDILKDYKGNIPFFLSGGIDLESISEISNLKSRLPNLYAIDINSKFELEPAVKDVNKLKLFQNELSRK